MYLDTILRLLVILGGLLCLSETQHLGDECTTARGRRGVCRELNACPVIKKSLIRGRRPKLCATSDSHTMIVCCPSSRPNTSPPSTSTTTTLKPTSPPIDFSIVANTTSERKCREYARSVFQLQRPAVLQLDNEMVNRSVCAILEVPLVVGGEAAKLNEFPHMALLGYGAEDTPVWYSGGSLISETYVLTAAHCLFSRHEGPVRWVRLGELQISNSNDGSEVQHMVVAERIPHPGYTIPARYNDLALVKLERPATFNAHVRPACLHRLTELPGEPESRSFIATGWGRVGYTDPTSDILQKVKLSYIDGATCNRSYRPEIITKKLMHGIDDDTMLCAGDLRGGRDTCQGDSGGPLQYVRREPYCMYNIVGVTSFGKFCGFRNSPAVYTRISNYINWIESIVWP